MDKSHQTMTSVAEWKLSAVYDQVVDMEMNKTGSLTRRESSFQIGGPSEDISAALIFIATKRKFLRSGECKSNNLVARKMNTNQGYLAEQI